MNTLYALNCCGRLEKATYVNSRCGYYTVMVKGEVKHFRSRNLFYEDGTSLNKSVRAFGILSIDTQYGYIRVFYHRQDIVIPGKNGHTPRKMYDHIYMVPDEYAPFINGVIDKMELRIAANWLTKL